MPVYDFRSLSSQDFEELVRDLFQAEWNIPLEAFKTGRDSGIDLRYASGDGGDIIIQCKHYATSGFSKLLRHLRDTEQPKVERLGPKRYVVVTSVSLTPHNKDEIIYYLRPYILNVSDVVGADDINGLLSRHPNIERSNFKLWLTSTAVLECVLHNAEHCQTNFAIDRIRRKLPLFVQNDAYPRAMQLLDQGRIVVISGIPGIGKTTLAEMLLFSYLERGFEPIVIQSEIAEGKKLYKSSAKQIFYFDDFLGQIFFGDRREYLGRNQDVAIVDFMQMIEHSSNALFIFTTREHILRGALQVSEKLAYSQILEHQCMLEMTDYSYEQKARILYNHLYFSGLPQPYKDAILENDFFLEIIKDENFNPRIMEWLSDSSHLRAVSHNVYCEHIKTLLKSPENIWKHAFQNQISDAARHVLLSLYSLGEWVDTRDLRPVFTSFHSYCAEKYKQRIDPIDFRSGLKELDGAFLSYSSNHVSYLNPSIRELVAGIISSNCEIAEDLLKSAIRFQQVVNLWRLSMADTNNELRTFLTSNVVLLHSSLSRLLETPSIRWEKTTNGSQRGYLIDIEPEHRIGFLVEVTENLESMVLATFLTKKIYLLIAKLEKEIVDFPVMVNLLKEIGENSWFLTHGGHQIHRRLLDGLLADLQHARANDWGYLLQFPEKAIEWTDDDEARLTAALKQYCTSGVRDERMDCLTLNELTYLCDDLEMLSSKFGLDFDYDIDRLKEEIGEREEAQVDSEGGSGYSYTPTRTAPAIDDEDIKQMFRTLQENSQ